MILEFTQQQNIRPISENNRNKWEQIANEVNEVTMYSMFGIDFMLDVEANLHEAGYEDLLNGSQYVVNNKTYTHGGLRKVLSYLVYAQYLKTTGLEDTFTGIVKQVRNETEEAKEGERANMVNSAYKIAYVNADRVKHYLNNYANFEKWECNNKENRVNVPNFLTINKK